MPVGPPVKIVRVIARLNIGGPAIQALTLTSQLGPLGYCTVLVRGREDLHEGDMNYLADQLDVEPVLISQLRRNPGLHDLPALARLVTLIRRERPMLVHTHAAKAGTLGRLAVLIAYPCRPRRPALVHTFHGHSLIGYFSPRVARLYRLVERLLARYTDVLIAVSEEVRDDLVALGVAAEDRFRVVPLGLNLDRFALDGEERLEGRARTRQELGVSPEETLLTLIARLVPIKRVDRFLRVARLLADVDSVRFLIVGDGELQDKLKGSTDAAALGPRVIWAGFRRDMPEICFASDVIVLTSDQEGTPVSLIEAGAAGVPTVSTNVGGAAMVVKDGETGLLVSVDDEPGLADAMRKLAADDTLRAQMAAAAQARILNQFGLERLLSDLDDLYRRLLNRRDR